MRSTPSRTILINKLIMNFNLYALSLISTAILLYPNASQARTFKNAYISFEMQDNWKCKLEQTEWVCRAEDPQEAKEAVIILTAKEKGPTDNFAIYKEHLAKPMNMAMKTSSSIKSTVTMPPRDLQLNEQTWIDSLHTNSEVQNYFTRYLATIKDQIAILVTFSVHNKYYTKHQAHFMDTIKSLRVIATKDLLSRPDMGPLRNANEALGPGISEAMPSDLLAADEDGQGQDQGGLLNNQLFLGLILLLLAGLTYVGIKIYQKSK